MKQAKGRAQAIASETRYRRLFETAQDGILILDADTGQIDDVNPFLIDMLGYAEKPPHERLSEPKKTHLPGPCFFSIPVAKTTTRSCAKALQNNCWVSDRRA
jgi:PAS domain-containing protein